MIGPGVTAASDQTETKTDNPPPHSGWWEVFSRPWVKSFTCFCFGAGLLCFHWAAFVLGLFYLFPFCVSPLKALQAPMAQLLLRDAHQAALFCLVSVRVTFLLWSRAQSHWFAPQSAVETNKKKKKWSGFHTFWFCCFFCWGCSKPQQWL